MSNPSTPALTQIWNLEYREAIDQVRHSLVNSGFDIIKETDLLEQSNNRFGDTDGYRFIVDCHKLFSKELNVEATRGMFPLFNLIIWKMSDAQVEVSALDPCMSMTKYQNKKFATYLEKLNSLLTSVVTQ